MVCLLPVCVSSTLLTVFWKLNGFWKKCSIFFEARKSLLVIAYRNSLSPYLTVTPPTVCDVYCLATIPHGRHSRVRNFLLRSSNACDFRDIWKGLCDFILMINSNFESISHRFRYTAIYRLKNAHFFLPHLCSTQNVKMLFYCIAKISVSAD